MRSLTIARATFREAFHLPVLHVVMVASVILLCIVGQLPRFTLSIYDDIKMLKDLAMATATLCGVLVAIFSAVNVITLEIENWTVVTVLSKPVRRWEFVVGKFIGLAFTLTAAFAILTVVYILVVWWGMWQNVCDYQAVYPELKANFSVLALAAADEMWRGMVMCLLQALVLAAVAVACCVRSPMIVSVVIFFTFFVAGHFVGAIERAAEKPAPADERAVKELTEDLARQQAKDLEQGLSVPSEQAKALGEQLRTLVEGQREGRHITAAAVGAFVLKAAIADQGSLSFSQEAGARRLITGGIMAWGLLYAAVYSAAVLLVAVLLFRNREVI